MTATGVARVSEALAAATDGLRAAGVGEARLDAELLLAAALGADRTALAAEPERDIEPAAARRYAELVRRRLAREPVAYILGRAWFRRLELAVDPRVLIPRPETEHVVEVALELLAGHGPAAAVDVGTGSGAIALALADEAGEGVDVTATDVSAGALAVARANAERLGLAGRVRFVQGDLLERLAGERFDLIASNPPYVAAGDWQGLQPEITLHEPRAALVAGPDGLDVLRALCAGVPERLVPGGALCVEVGAGQAGAVAALMERAGLGGGGVRRDLAGIERVVWARRP